MTDTTTPTDTTTSTTPPSSGPMRVAVTGASGLIGRPLVERLKREGHTVSRLVRDPAKAGPGDILWDPEAGTLDAATLEGIDAAVHLAGESVATRWTDEKKRLIMESRVKGTRLLAKTLARLAKRPRVLVQASAVGLYGDRGDETLTEASPAGTGFLADVAREWEGASASADEVGIRVVRLRIGVVLAREGGALEQMLPAFRLGAGGKLGTGRQWMPWLSLDDAVEIVMRALHDERLRGPVNTVAGSVRNADFTEALGRALHRPTLVPVPAFGLRLLFGEMADGALLASQRAEPARLNEIGHVFHHPTLNAALAAALK
jgi:uncharacterized protein (TIGR01777 family)